MITAIGVGNNLGRSYPGLPGMPGSTVATSLV
jgi:hypothetical protein